MIENHRPIVFDLLRFWEKTFAKRFEVKFKRAFAKISGQRYGYANFIIRFMRYSYTGICLELFVSFASCHRRTFSEPS